MCLRTSDTNQDVGVVVDTSRDVFCRGQDTANDKVAETHGQSTVDEKWPTASLVDVEEHDCCKHDKECVLDSGGDEIDVSSQTGHLENVHNIVLRACQLSTGAFLGGTLTVITLAPLFCCHI